MSSALDEKLPRPVAIGCAGTLPLLAARHSLATEQFRSLPFGARPMASMVNAINMDFASPSPCHVRSTAHSWGSPRAAPSQAWARGRRRDISQGDPTTAVRTDPRRRLGTIAVMSP